MKEFLKDIKKKNYGDAVERVTKATGIKKAVDAISEATGIDCGCEARKDAWNIGKRNEENNQTTKTGF